MIAVGGLTGPAAISLIDAAREGELARLRDAPVHARAITAFRERIGDVDSPEALIADRELYVFVMRAFDLEDRIFGAAMMREILGGDPGDPEALVNRLTDPRFTRMHAALGLHPGGRGLTAPRQQEAVIDTYLETRFENDLSAQDPRLGAAMAFRRAAADLPTPFHVLADPQHAQVVRIALGLPDAVAALSVDRQAEMIAARLDLSRLTVTAEVDRIVVKYLVLSDAGPTSAPRSAALQLLTAVPAEGIAPVIRAPPGAWR